MKPTTRDAKLHKTTDPQKPKWCVTINIYGNTKREVQRNSRGLWQVIQNHIIQNREER